MGITPPPLHGVPGLDRSDLKVVEASGEGLRVEASEGTGGKKAVEGGSGRAVLEFLEDTSVRRRLSVGGTRLPRAEEAGEGEVSEGEEGGTGSP